MTVRARLFASARVAVVAVVIALALLLAAGALAQSDNRKVDTAVDASGKGVVAASSSHLAKDVSSFHASSTGSKDGKTVHGSGRSSTATKTTNSTPAATISSSSSTAMKTTNSTPAATISSNSSTAMKTTNSTPAATVSSNSSTAMKTTNSTPAATISSSSSTAMKTTSSTPAATISSSSSTAMKTTNSTPAATISSGSSTAMKTTSSTPAATISSSSSTAMKTTSSTPAATISSSSSTAMKTTSSTPAATISSGSSTAMKTTSSTPAATISSSSSAAMKTTSSTPAATISSSSSAAMKTTSSTLAPKSTKNNDNGDDFSDGGVSMFVFIPIVLFLLIAILYSCRAFPRQCPFSRRGGGAGTRGSGRRASSNAPRYARLDGGAFSGDEEDYRNMELGRAAVGFHACKPMRGSYADDDGKGDVEMEMEEKLQGRVAVTGRVVDERGALSTTAVPPLPHDSAVQASGVVDHHPAALDAFLGEPSTAAPSSAPTLVPAKSKNSLKAMRKGKLGPATSLLPFGSTSGGTGARGGVGSEHDAAAKPPHKEEDWGWSDEDENN